MFSIIKAALIGSSLITSAFCYPAPTDGYPASTAGPPVSSDGFPTPNDAQLKAIEKTALGTLSNAGLPPAGALDAGAITVFQLIQLNENWEVSFFKSLLYNISNSVEGFAWGDKNETDFLVLALEAVVAQEELHALTAGAVLKSQGVAEITCYNFAHPTTTLKDALALATTFGPVVLGTLGDASQIFADGLKRSGKDEGAFTRIIASVIGQEGEQNGFYRALQTKIPSEAPFLTTGVADYAYTFLNSIIVDDCAAAKAINLKIYGALSLLTPVTEAKSQTLKFEFDVASLSKSKGITVVDTTKVSADYDWSQTSIVYINQLNVPVVQKLDMVATSGSVVSFEAYFPYDEYVMGGLTIVSVVHGAGPFADATAVAAAAVFAPAFIAL